MPRIFTHSAAGTYGEDDWAEGRVLMIEWLGLSIALTFLRRTR